MLIGKPVEPNPLAPWPSDPNEGVLLLHPGYQMFFAGFHENDPVNGTVFWADGFVNMADAFTPDVARDTIQLLLARGHITLAVRRTGTFDHEGNPKFPICYIGGAQ